jgi:hypothetical protein
MSEMVDRVALVISGQFPDVYEALPPAERAMLLYKARAAIEAMRKPGAAVIDALEEAMTYDAGILAETTWEKLIDAALT